MRSSASFTFNSLCIRLIWLAANSTNLSAVAMRFRLSTRRRQVSVFLVQSHLLMGMQLKKAKKDDVRDELLQEEENEQAREMENKSRMMHWGVAVYDYGMCIIIA